MIFTDASSGSNIFTFHHQEILAVARSIKDEVDPAALSLSGARLLQLLEPFLESLVPVEVVVIVVMMKLVEGNFLCHFLSPLCPLRWC